MTLIVYVRRFNISIEPMEIVVVSTPVGKSVLCRKIVKNCMEVWVDLIGFTHWIFLCLSTTLCYASSILNFGFDPIGNHFIYFFFNNSGLYFRQEAFYWDQSPKVSMLCKGWEFCQTSFSHTNFGHKSSEILVIFLDSSENKNRILLIEAFSCCIMSCGI